MACRLVSGSQYESQKAGVRGSGNKSKSDKKSLHCFLIVSYVALASHHCVIICFSLIRKVRFAPLECVAGFDRTNNANNDHENA